MPENAVHSPFYSGTRYA